ncbi:MAG TPA: hypothetical protein VFH27_01770 [Longimicrobiaceae bacterium]|nr:hypothetical protein [Longimicrobiaceae bacterium]
MHHPLNVSFEAVRRVTRQRAAESRKAELAGRPQRAETAEDQLTILAAALLDPALGERAVPVHPPRDEVTAAVDRILFRLRSQR